MIEWTQHRGDWSALNKSQPMLFGSVYKQGHAMPPWHWAVSTDERRISSGDSETLEAAKASVEDVFRARAKASVRHAP